MKKLVKTTTSLTLEPVDILDLIKTHGILFKDNKPWSKDQWPTEDNLIVRDAFYTDADETEPDWVFCIQGLFTCNVFFVAEKYVQEAIKQFDPTFSFTDKTDYSVAENTITFVNEY